MDYNNLIARMKDRKLIFENAKQCHMCKTCKQVMFDSCQTTCGCRFCRQCISSYVDCPCCEEEDIQYFSDFAINREILNLSTKCPNIRCEKPMIFRDLFQHMIDCKHESVKCPITACGKYLDSLTLCQHLENDRHETLLLSKFIEYKCKWEGDIGMLKKQMNAVETQLLFASIDPNLFGPNTWIIYNIRQKIIAARNGGQSCIINTPKYLSERGYLFAIKIYLNGDGAANKDYLSIFFVICKGKYDNENTWKFKKNLKLVVKGNTVPDLVNKMKPDDNFGVYGKPVTFYNRAAGNPKFILIDDIMKSTNYTHDDALIVGLSLFS